MAIAGLKALMKLSDNDENAIAMRPHIGVIVNLLQEHSSNAEVMKSNYGTLNA